MFFGKDERIIESGKILRGSNLYSIETENPDKSKIEVALPKIQLL